MHAAIEFTIAHPRCTADWHRASNTLVVAVASGELALHYLAEQAAVRRLSHSRFYEPDRGGELTAVAVEPAGGRLFTHLPLMGGGEHGQT